MLAESLCIIPARGGSKRLPRKNLALLADRPLLAYTIEAALQSQVFEQVCVSTEDEGIANVARQYGASVPFIRPPELSADSVGVVQVCLHALDFFAEHSLRSDILGVLLPTSPLRTAGDIQDAYERFLSSDADFLMSVTDYVYSPFQALHEQEGFLKPFWDPTYYRKHSQELPRVVVDNGAIYLMHVEAFRRERIFYGKRLIGHYMPQERSIDVDDAYTFELANLLLQRQRHPDGGS